MAGYEIRTAPPADTDPPVDRLERFIEAAAAEVTAAGVPVTKDGRIDMLAYRGRYDSAEMNLAGTQEGSEDAGRYHEERLLTDGEKLEMLAYAVFTKNLGPDFVVARSAPHDDKVNHVDTLIFEKATGNLVCAFDEVSDTQGTEYEKKVAAVRKRNLEGGATLKYGLRLEEAGGEKRIALDDVDHIPLFYVALPPAYVHKGVAEFIPDNNRQSAFEKKLFEYFLSAITRQIQANELPSSRLDPKLKKRFDDFKKVIEDPKRVTRLDRRA